MPEEARGTKRKSTDNSSSPSKRRPNTKAGIKRKEADSANAITEPCDPPPTEPAPPTTEPPRKRPKAAPVSRTHIEAARKRAEEREIQQQQEVKQSRGEVQDAVTQHYNAVPERGRDWRKTDSKIKGLRSYNNWVKSCVINKFSKNQNRDEDPYAPIKVLDIGCGKGGDLFKWQSAPQRVELYVGLDPAEVSIKQARERYASMGKQNRDRGRNDRRRKQLFDAQFHVEDCFANSLDEIPVVRQVGYDASVGPGQIQRWGGGGFDVVSMMFCLHYSFESEEKARCMLKNVAASLKKGGRFLGVMPNSAVISAKVKEHHKAKAGVNGVNGAPATTADEDDDDWDPEKPTDAPKETPNASDVALGKPVTEDDDWDPERSLDAGAAQASPEAAVRPPWEDDDDDWDPEKPIDAQQLRSEPANGEKSPEEAEQKKDEGFSWGNDIYTVKFPGATPADGLFRPPYGWKYFYFLEEAVEEVPEYVVPWEFFRALAEDYNLELQYEKPFPEVWEEEKDDHHLGRNLAERMGVRDRNTGDFLISDKDMDAASFYKAFCFYKV